MVSSLSCFSSTTAGYFSLEALQEFLSGHFELFLVIACVIGYLFYAQREQEHIQNVIEQPRQSDFFYVDYLAIDDRSNRKHRYVPMKVLEVTQTGVKFKVGNIAHSTPVSPREHAKFDKALALKNYYREKELLLSFEQIRQMRESGVIYNARRPKSIYIDGWIVIPKNEMYVEP